MFNNYLFTQGNFLDQWWKVYLKQLLPSLSKVHSWAICQAWCVLSKFPPSFAKTDVRQIPCYWLQIYSLQKVLQHNQHLCFPSIRNNLKKILYVKTFKFRSKSSMIMCPSHLFEKWTLLWNEVFVQGLDRSCGRVLQRVEGIDELAEGQYHLPDRRTQRGESHNDYTYKSNC